MLLSQSGKFIPKFMAKKKIADCVVKIERASKLAETDNCSMPLSETETGLESQTLGTGSPAYEVRDSAHADSIVVKDTVTDNDEPMPVECGAGLEANEHGAFDREQSASPNKGMTESIGSNTQALPVDTALQLNDIVVDDHSNINNNEGCTSAEENENSTLNADVLDQKEYSLHVDQHDISEATKLLSFSSSNDVSKAAACTPDAVTAPVTDEDCTEPRDLQIAGYKNNQPPVDTVEVSGGGKAVSNDEVTAAAVQSELIVEDAPEHIHSVVAEVGINVSLMPVAVPENVEACPDAESNESREKLEMYDSTENNGGDALYTAVVQSDISRVDGEIDANNKTEVGNFDAVSVNGAAAKDCQAETGDNVEVGTVSKAREFITGSSEPAIFNDFLDLTDSQLCQLDDVSR